MRIRSLDARLRVLEESRGAADDRDVVRFDDLEGMAPAQVAALYRRSVRDEVRVVGGPPAPRCPYSREQIEAMTREQRRAVYRRLIGRP